MTVEEDHAAVANLLAVLVESALVRGVSAGERCWGAAIPRYRAQ